MRCRQPRPEFEDFEHYLPRGDRFLVLVRSWLGDWLFHSSHSRWRDAIDQADLNHGIALRRRKAKP